MSPFYLGTYWRADRALTLRQYVDATKGFLRMLQSTHPAFRSLEWVGDRPNSTISLTSGMGNLDDLVYRHAGSKEHLFNPANPDGTPLWDSLCKFGYSMTYGTGPSPAGGGLTIAIGAGSYGLPLSNAVWIGFPPPEDQRFSQPEFYDYAFLKALFCQMVEFWAPTDGLVTQHAFNSAVTDEGLPYAGWLTYVRDPRAAALRNSDALRGLIFEQMPGGGTLISLDTAIISPDNPTQVENARRLRSLLIAEKLV